MADQPIRITHADFSDPKVQAYLEEQEARRRAMPEVTAQPLIIRVIYSSYFYLSVASGLGALCAWAILEPFFDEGRAASGGFHAVNFLLFPTVTGAVGLFLGAAEGLMSRNFLRALLCASVGLGVGFVGGLVLLIPAGMVFVLMARVALTLGPPKGPHQMPHGLGLLALFIGRGAAWTIASSAAGLGQGIALREKRVVVNGLLGGVLGGLLGGVLFDPISLLIGATQNAAVSRAIGFTVIGVMVGLFVGLVEQWTKTAWLLMRAGPLAGKQFVIYRNPTVIGSSPKAEIYVFKDPAIEPRHALIHDRGGRFELEDCGTPDGTYINGVPIKRQVLKPGDQIVVGKTVLEFSLKEAK